MKKANPTPKSPAVTNFPTDKMVTVRGGGDPIADWVDAGCPNDFRAPTRIPRTL